MNVWMEGRWCRSDEASAVERVCFDKQDDVLDSRVDQPVARPDREGGVSSRALGALQMGMLLSTAVMGS